MFGHLVKEQVNQTYWTTMWSGSYTPTVGTQFGNPAYHAVVRATYSISPTLLSEVSYDTNGWTATPVPAQGGGDEPAAGAYQRGVRLQVANRGTSRAERAYPRKGKVAMLTFLIWCVVLFFCWPLALLALVLYPIVWLLLLPFRIVGIAVGGVLELVWAIITLPARLVRKIA